MKIKLLAEVEGSRGMHGAGCVVEFPDEVAQDLIDAKKAEEVKDSEIATSKKKAKFGPV